MGGEGDLLKSFIWDRHNPGMEDGRWREWRGFIGGSRMRTFKYRNL